MAAVKKQGTWSKEAGYIWSMIGSAVGFANILSFSALCYKNGGGAFLIPYILAHLVVGLPMLILEGSIGHHTKLPIVSAMGRVAGTWGKMLGWLAVLTCATIGGFYVVLTGYSVAYTYFSATGTIGSDSAFFFKHIFLKDSGSLTAAGGVAAGVLLSTLIVALFSWSVMARNIHSGVEKICSFFMPLLGVIVVLFSGAALLLPGAAEGIRHYLIPDFSRLSDWVLWRDVFGQVFFSLSLGLGIVTGYSRHNPSSFNIPRSMLKVAIGDFVISFISGFAIFGCIGFMSAKTGIPFAQLVPSDSAFEIGFVIFPTILAQFGTLFSRIIGPLFFFCVFIAGVTGFFSIVENVAGNIEIEFNKSRKTAVAIAMAFVGALAFPFCMGNSQHLLGALSPMVLGNALLIGGIAEIVLFLILSKVANHGVVSHGTIWLKGKRGTYPYYALKYGVLPLLSFSLLGAIYQESVAGITTAAIVRFCWFALVVGAAGVLTYRRAAVKNVETVTTL
jgi:neurotransmitter:Na+ symporter, NSS family